MKSYIKLMVDDLSNYMFRVKKNNNLKTKKI